MLRELAPLRLPTCQEAACCPCSRAASPAVRARDFFTISVVSHLWRRVHPTTGGRVLTCAHVCQEDWIPTGEMASCKIVPFLMSLRVWVAKHKTEQKKKTILKQHREVNQ